MHIHDLDYQKYVDQPIIGGNTPSATYNAGSSANGFGTLSTSTLTAVGAAKTLSTTTGSLTTSRAVSQGTSSASSSNTLIPRLNFSTLTLTSTAGGRATASAGGTVRI